MTGIRLYQATDSGWANIGGKDVLIQAGQIAHGDHPILKSHGHMFAPMVIDYGPPGPAEDEPKAAGQKRAAKDTPAQGRQQKT